MYIHISLLDAVIVQTSQNVLKLRTDFKIFFVSNVLIYDIRVNTLKFSYPLPFQNVKFILKETFKMTTMHTFKLLM